MSAASTPIAPIALTSGEPAGVGPEITAKAWATLKGDVRNSFFLIGDADYFLARARSAGLPITIAKIARPEEATVQFGQALPILHRPLSTYPSAGHIDTLTATSVIAAIDEAVDLTLAGKASAVVTNPIQKEALYSAGFKHQGHTDYLASLAITRGFKVQEVMMLVAGNLRAVPITVHIPLKDVPQALSADMIIAQAHVVARNLQKYFGVDVPRLAFTGLNPHAGENGAMGREEQTIIVPALHKLRADGFDVTGPLPADTAFHAEARTRYDAILCMYHDQALIPAKTLDFHGGVNVSLGLPFVRTSPDHGTALGIAGQGIANPQSLIAALELAGQMVANARG